MQVMFEHYGFDAAYVAIQAVLTLYAQGLLTGAFGCVCVHWVVCACVRLSLCAIGCRDEYFTTKYSKQRSLDLSISQEIDMFCHI